MEYTLILIIHLLSAIIFIGFIFADVIVFPAVKNKLGVEFHTKMIEAIVGRGLKIYPPIVVLLMGTGGYMFSKYVNSELGYFETPMQILLWIKFAFVVLIVLGVIYTMYCKLTKTAPIAFMNYFHSYALVLGIAIVILAKVMFVV
ncbi:hypothetical protein [Poseidonibacter ostreae]|jgi:uncharacterized protein|uniref:Copper resistance protein CopD n=1 Tax=Poseidonibacter ostreae TaxID=2654171 RepID=A0A6L4WR62_9BACT|nr:hypothetical protein [Poseidonibacter ostreae]KAB7885434.1 hypothetical protein GA417_08355 [Poseidonibacter ostreae]KAB7887849.1 hypothetical protein GBG19_10190 [Poseidonibacter ostreae]